MSRELENLVDEALNDFGDGPRTMKATADWANKWAPRLAQIVRWVPRASAPTRDEPDEGTRFGAVHRKKLSEAAKARWARVRAETRDEPVTIDVAHPDIAAAADRLCELAQAEGFKAGEKAGLERAAREIIQAEARWRTWRTPQGDACADACELLLLNIRAAATAEAAATEEQR